MQRQPHWRIIIAAVVVLTLAAYLVLLWFNKTISLELFWLSVKLVTVASSAIYLLWIIFDKWLWRLFPLLPFDTWPDLNGTWKGTGQITVLPPTNDPPPPVDLTVEITIIQTYTALWVNFKSTVTNNPNDVTFSHARAALVRPNEKSPYELEYHFITRSGAHGLAILIVQPGTAGAQPELRGEWISDTKQPIAGTVRVIRTRRKANS